MLNWNGNKLRNEKNIMKVAVIDSSPEAAKVICEKLEKMAGFLTSNYEVKDTVDFLERLRSNLPDVLVLDIEMSKLAGHEILFEIIHYQLLPVIVTCFPTQKGKLGVVQAMELGAIDFITKPSTYFPKYLDDFLPLLIQKLNIASKINISALRFITENKIKFNIPTSNRDLKKDLVTIAVDNAALESFRRLVIAMPHNFPCVIAVLNLPAGYTKLFADRLNEIARVSVREAHEKDKIERGTVLISPGDFHTKVNSTGGEPFIELSLSEKVNNRRPSADVTMMSIAEHIGKRAIGVLSSGYGEDGVIGLKAMKMSGAETIVIDPDTAILNSRLIRAIDIDSHTHIVKFKDFPKLLTEFF